MSEAELAEKFFHLFPGYEIYKEVPTSYGRCDFFAVLGKLHIAVEVKKQFSTDVIYQATRNFSNSHYSYVAVPQPKDKQSAYAICKLLGIGVLFYDDKRRYNVPDQYDFPDGSCVKRILYPTYRRAIMPPRLLDTMKEAVAGAPYNTMSEFKVTVRLWERSCRENGGSISLNDLFNDTGNFHYSSPKHARQAVLTFVRTGVLKQFKIEKGVLHLLDTANKV